MYEFKKNLRWTENKNIRRTNNKNIRWTKNKNIRWTKNKNLRWSKNKNLKWSKNKRDESTCIIKIGLRGFVTQGSSTKLTSTQSFHSVY